MEGPSLTTPLDGHGVNIVNLKGHCALCLFHPNEDTDSYNIPFNLNYSSRSGSILVTKDFDNLWSNLFPEECKQFLFLREKGSLCTSTRIPPVCGPCSTTIAKISDCHSKIVELEKLLEILKKEKNDFVDNVRGKMKAVTSYSMALPSKRNKESSRFKNLVQKIITQPSPHNYLLSTVEFLGLVGGCNLKLQIKFTDTSLEKKSNSSSTSALVNEAGSSPKPLPAPTSSTEVRKSSFGPGTVIGNKRSASSMFIPVKRPKLLTSTSTPSPSRVSKKRLVEDDHDAKLDDESEIVELDPLSDDVVVNPDIRNSSTPTKQPLDEGTQTVLKSVARRNSMIMTSPQPQRQKEASSSYPNGSRNGIQNVSNSTKILKAVTTIKKTPKLTLKLPSRNAGLSEDVRHGENEEMDPLGDRININPDIPESTTTTVPPIQEGIQPVLKRNPKRLPSAPPKMQNGAQAQVPPPSIPEVAEKIVTVVKETPKITLPLNPVPHLPNDGKHCPMCEAKVKLGTLLKHLKTSHSLGKYAFKCPKPKCHAVFISKYAPSYYQHFSKNSECRKVARISSLDKIKCSTCGESFPRKGFRSHLKKVHETSEKFFKCPVKSCKEEFTDNQSVEWHLVTHTASFNRYKSMQRCELCPSLPGGKGKPLVMLEQMHEHLNNIHDAKEIVKCSICNFLFSSRDNLLEHLNVHLKEGKSVSCDICNRPEDQNCIFTKHLELKDHYFDMHKIGRKYFCEFCDVDVSFYSVDEYRMHKYNVHKKKFQCEECADIFFVLSQLQKHCVNYHSEFKCSNCNLTFPFESERDAHEEKCYIVPSISLSEVKKLGFQKYQGADPNKMYKCKDCHISFKRAESMVRHRENKELGITFTCDKCGGQEGCRERLRRHICPAATTATTDEEEDDVKPIIVQSISLD